MLSFEVFWQQPDEKLALRKFQGGEACTGLAFFTSIRTEVY
jgi:hypothetical protein